MVLHIVEPGQTLYSIARQYGVSPERLRTNNGIGPTAQLAVGQCIAVLFPLVTHVVRAGETLYSIADAYGTTVLQLLRNNLFLNGRDLLLRHIAKISQHYYLTLPVRQVSDSCFQIQQFHILLLLIHVVPAMHAFRYQLIIQAFDARKRIDRFQHLHHTFP